MEEEKAGKGTERDTGEEAGGKQGKAASQTPGKEKARK